MFAKRVKICRGGCLKPRGSRDILDSDFYRAQRGDVIMAVTGLAYCEEMLSHDTGPKHPENASRLREILEAFQAEGLAPPRIPIAKAAESDLLRVHTPKHLEAVRSICAANGKGSDEETPMSRGSWDAALFAAGAAIAACGSVLDRTLDNAFCAIRPPGHHAEPERVMGFCLFNNVAIAARWLLDEAGLARVAIVDWDVHHGNGTQKAFYEESRVFFASIHQHPHYPHTGLPEERGEHGNILNVQMRRNSGPDEWLAAIDERIAPAIREFAPEFLLISAGFDAHRLDSMGNQRLESETFGAMTNLVKNLANGRVVSVLEGGYKPEALRDSCVAHFRALQGDA
jgi:acetoin utilization deacetylase AcuC-like enzyme